MASKNEVAAQIMEQLCIRPTHGYSQPGRWGSGPNETLVVDGATYTFAGGDRDCSSAVISAYQAAGVDCGGATYTGNMRNCMCSSGNFTWEPMSFIAQRGDIYLNEADHTAMCTSANPDMLAQFSESETGGIDGQPGDQTGTESEIIPYYNFPWDGILHYIGEGGSASPEPGTGSHPDTSIPNLAYRVCTSSAGWLPEMINWSDTGSEGDDFAGNNGQPITYLAINMPGWYQVCTEKQGWLSRVSGYNIYDEMNGCAGDGSPINKVRCYYETQNPSSTGWLSIEYQVADIGSGWFAPMHDTTDTSGYGDDYAGNGGRIDRFRARLVRNSW